MSRPLLILRPEPGNSATAARAAALKISAAQHPLFIVRPEPWTSPDPKGFDALLLTSANALRHGGAELAKLHSLPVIAVGAATAEAARAEGFTVIAEGARGAQAALDLVPAATRILWLCGRDRSALASGGKKIAHITVYAADPTTVHIDLSVPSVALIHSTRAGKRFSEISGDQKSHHSLIAISVAAAAAAGSGWRSVDITDTPTDAAMLALARRVCEQD